MDCVNPSVDPREEIGRRIREIRIRRKLTPEGLAAIAELDVSNIRKIETGANPTITTLLRIVGVLEVELGDLLRDVSPYALPADQRPLRLSEVPETFFRPTDRIA